MFVAAVYTVCGYPFVPPRYKFPVAVSGEINAYRSSERALNRALNPDVYPVPWEEFHAAHVQVRISKQRA